MEARDVQPDKFWKKKYKLEEIYDLKKGSHAKGSTACFCLLRRQLNLYKEKITHKWFTIKVILHIKYLQDAAFEVNMQYRGYSQATEKSTWYMKSSKDDIQYKIIMLLLQPYVTVPPTDNWWA